MKKTAKIDINLQKSSLEMFEENGLLGCFEGSSHLSTNYQKFISEVISKKQLRTSTSKKAGIRKQGKMDHEKIIDSCFFKLSSCSPPEVLGSRRKKISNFDRDFTCKGIKHCFMQKLGINKPLFNLGKPILLKLS